MIYPIAIIEDFVPNYRNEVLSFALRIPVAMELIALAKTSYDLETSIEDKDIKLQNRLSTAASLGLSILSMACNNPTIYLASSVALTTLALAVKTYKNPNWISEKIEEVYRSLTDTSTPLLTLRNASIALAIIPIIGFSGHALKLALSGKLIQFTTNYAHVNAQFLKNVNHPVIVYAAHIGMGIVALQKSLSAYKRKDYSNALFYGITAPVTIGSPFHYHYHARHLLRWHHFSYGVSAMLTSLRSFKLFGTMMAMDGMSYFFKRAQHPYDYSDIFANNTGNIMGATLLGASMQSLTSAMNQKHIPKKS